MPVAATPAPEPDRWYAQEELTGSKVRLAPLRLEHAEGYLAAAQSDGGGEEVFRWLGNGSAPQTVSSARTEILQALAARARGERFAYVQLDAPTGDVIGTTSYYELAPAARCLAIGHTWLGRRWWRTGHNTESKLLLLTHAFDTLGAARVVWHTDIRNTRSQAAIERLGATKEGVLRKHRIRHDGTWRDTVQYAMTDEDWPSARTRLAGRLAAG
ncbi:MAG: GNAT family N-acetyltransferase [Jatrophihabitantaceae bacterium]